MTLAVATRPVRVQSCTEASVSMLVVNGLVGALERAGVTRERFLHAAELDVGQLGMAEARISRSRVYALCALALELSGDPALGLHWSERVDEGSFVPVSHVMAHSATLRQAFESLAQFHALLTDQPRFELLERNDKATVRVFPSGDSLETQRFLAEMAVCGVFRLLRHVDPHPAPDLVCFEYAAPPYQPEYARIFQGALRFEQSFTGIVFDRAWLDRPALRKDDEVREALELLAQRRLRRIARNVPYAVRVREFLVSQRRGLRTDMSVVARALQLSVRSLRRRLAAEGTAYGEIANAALADMAKHLLRDEERSIQETAYELGFASFSAFHRAFRRATGTTPNAFRDSVTDAGARH
jgi:AraC-like DNA-binding protein